ncbi:MAG: O-antigen ligase family protein [Kiritimatiellia bacterium]
MKFFNKILSWSAFTCACVAVLPAPWFFGAWEMWWFWVFAAFLFLSVFFFGLMTLTRPSLSHSPHNADVYDPEARTNARLVRICLTAWLIFLAYALVRALQAEVFMNAERSFLLFFTPFLLGVEIVFGWNRIQMKSFSVMLAVNFFCLAAYGIINHYCCNSEYVMWVKGYERYITGHRATGSYFCPDHFAGAMELCLCLAGGLLLSRGNGILFKASGALLALPAVLGVVLSKSRGGLLTLIVLAVAVAAWGFNQWRPLSRWLRRSFLLAAAGVLVAAFAVFGGAHFERFKNYFDWDRASRKSAREAVSHVLTHLKTTSRGRMIAGALRAWGENKLFGIGPGMHQNLWPHYAASGEGDRTTGTPPLIVSTHFHSYQVHSDWIQLMEEYGLIGLALFLAAAAATLAFPITAIRREMVQRRDNNWQTTGNEWYWSVLAGFFAAIAMGFHSLGDFNLQMPATVWMFASMVAVSIARTVNKDNDLASE